jgi:hypothetical protein
VPFRSGGDQVVLDALAGRSLTGRRYSAAFLVEKGYACSVEVRIEPCRISGAMHEKPFSTLYSEFIAKNQERNARIAAIAVREVSAGRSVLVLVERIRHGQALRAAIHKALEDPAAGSVPRDETLAAGSVPRSAGLVAGPVQESEAQTSDPVSRACDVVHGKLARTRLADITRAFSEGKLPCLVATAGLFQEGVSIDGIEVLIQGGGLKSKTKVIQSVGRGMRLSPGKSACTYYDFMDDDEAGVFRAHARKRIAALKEEGFFVAAEEVPSIGPRGPCGPCSPRGTGASGLPRASREQKETEHPRASAAVAPDLLAGPDGGPDPPPSESSDPGQPRPDGRAWFHVSGTKRFLLVDDEGRTCATGVCLKKDLVPRKACGTCMDKTVCERGGRILWQGE